jgi:uncharacterized membrane protein
MIEQIPWFYSFSANNWWILLIVVILLKIIGIVMVSIADEDSSLTYLGFVTLLYLMYIITLLITIVVCFTVLFGYKSEGKVVGMRDVPNLTVTTENNIATIESLPKNFRYSEIDGHRLKPSINQKFKYKVNQDFGTAYLVSEDGGKFKLSDEDKEYLKERGVR